MNIKMNIKMNIQMNIKMNIKMNVKMNIKNLNEEIMKNTYIVFLNANLIVTL